MDHGLFGKLTPGTVTEFADWRDIARRVYKNSKKHITMYRSVISFEEATAEELRLTDQRAWQRYIENHILTIAEKNGIKPSSLQWACALHKEKGHPHIHVVFWDTSSRVKDPFTPPAIPNAIRRQMIKDTFPDKILAYGKDKNFATSELRRISDELVDEFEKHIRQFESKKYKQIREEYNIEDSQSNNFDFGNLVLNETANQVFKIKAALPEHGRIAYQLLTPDTKKQVDELVKYLFKNVSVLQEQKAFYIQSKMKMVRLYGGNEEYLTIMKKKFTIEADKIVANRILSMVKTLNRLDGEMKSTEYYFKRQQFYMENMLLEALSMLSVLADMNNQQFETESKISGNLSKEAKKELYLKRLDKGYEH